jgi:Na+/melibiose symporter-like transporter
MMMAFNNLFPVLIGYGLGWPMYGEYAVLLIFYTSNYGMLPVLSRLVKSRPVDKIIVKFIKYGVISLVVLYVLMLITGFSWFLYLILALGGAMLMVGLYGTLIGGNVIDHDELETGQRREALYVGASSLVLIPMEQIVGSIVAVVLIVVNYDLEAGFTQDPLVLAGIRFLTFFIIFIGAVFTLISMKLYPFKGEALVKLKKDIMELHAKKEADAHLNQESFSKS